MAERTDILLEADTTLDGGGNYTSPWIDVSEISSVAMVWTSGVGAGSGYPRLQLSADATNVIGSIDSISSLSAYGVPSRYIRFQESGGTASATFRLSIKAIS